MNSTSFYKCNLIIGYFSTGLRSILTRAYFEIIQKRRPKKGQNFDYCPCPDIFFFFAFQLGFSARTPKPSKSGNPLWMTSPGSSLKQLSYGLVSHGSTAIKITEKPAQ